MNNPSSPTIPLFLGQQIARNVFSNVPVEFVVPGNCPVVIVCDLYSSEYKGGAELTTEAILDKSPYPVFKIHSPSLTAKMLDKHKDKYWIIGNFTQADPSALAYLATGGFKYSIIEYDYKYCAFRSEVLHQKQTGHLCDCPLRPHGFLVEKLYSNAEKIFWMSEAQKEHVLSRIPSLFFAKPEQHVIQSSTFSDEALEKMAALRAARQIQSFKIWGVQGSNNWIKGTKETVELCAKERLPVKILSDLSPEKFLEELSKCHGLVFNPLDFDTCPRVVIEAKLLGLELRLNENVQHQHEDWFKGSIEETETYLRERGPNFWRNIVL